MVNYTGKKFKSPAKPIIIMAPAETLTCKKCGKTYTSRGKYDSGICRDCERNDAPLIGGVLDESK